jgi:anti-sigma factor RsiW
MIHNSDCNKLDAYLGGDLSADDVSRFESHLEVCGGCREAVDEQQWIDDLLQSPARMQIEPTPAASLDSFRIAPARRRRALQAACGLAAAAALLVAVGWPMLNRQARHPSVAEVQNVTVNEPSQIVDPVQPQATFVTTADSIVVPVDSPSTDVTVVQVYPTTDTERRWRLEQSLLSISTKSNGG